MCTALPPRRSTVTANTAATIHSLLWPTVVLASGAIDDARRVLVAPLARLWPRSGMTLPPEDLGPLFLVRGGVFLPRRILALRGPGRSTLPRSSPFLWYPIVLPILRCCSIDSQSSALRLVHTELLRREGPDPGRGATRVLLDLEPGRGQDLAPPENGLCATYAHGKFGRTDAPSLPPGDESLYEAILPRVERDDHEPSARHEKPFRGVEGPPEAAQLVVNPDPHGLEDPLRRVAAPMLPAHRRPYGLVEVRRNREGSPPNDLPRHTSRLTARHVAVLREHPRQLPDIGGVQEVPGRRTRPWVHAHVQRSLVNV